MWWGRGRQRQRVRLPQDVEPGEVRGVPSPDQFPHAVVVYERQHEAAVDGDPSARALACWGLVHAGRRALPWVERQLRSGDADRIADAAGVLAHVGVPPDVLPQVQRLSESLADSEARDAVLALLPVPDQARQDVDGLLLGGALDAFTESIWFVEASLADVVSAARAWEEEQPFEQAMEPCSGSLSSLLALLEPWAMPSWKRLWVETDSAWTALFSQGSDIYDTDVLARRLDCRSLATDHTPAVARAGRVVRYANTALRYRDPHQSTAENSLGDTRVLQATQQSRWEWHALGPVQPFEEPERYEARVVRDRFDLATLNAYCRRLGIRRDDPTFYGTGGHLVSQDISSWAAPPRTASAEEWLSVNR